MFAILLHDFKYGRKGYIVPKGTHVDVAWKSKDISAVKYNPSTCGFLAIPTDYLDFYW
jgi:hypothetical protein